MESVLKINQNSPSRAAAFLAAPLYWLCSLRSPWRRKPKMSPPLSGESVRQVWAKKGPPQGRTVVKTSAAANEKRRNSWFKPFKPLKMMMSGMKDPNLPRSVLNWTIGRPDSDEIVLIFWLYIHRTVVLTHSRTIIWLVVWTILKNISQWEGLSHILWKIKNVWNHQPDHSCCCLHALSQSIISVRPLDFQWWYLHFWPYPVLPVLYNWYF